VAIDLSGFKELDDALVELPKAFRRPAMIAALKRAAKPIVNAARACARRGSDPAKRGSKKQRLSGQSEAIGPAADSIKARAVSQADVEDVATNQATKYASGPGGTVQIAVGPDKAHWYYKFVEFGTSRQSGDHAITAAFEAHQQEFLKILGPALWSEIEKAARKAAFRHAATGTQ